MRVFTARLAPTFSKLVVAAVLLGVTSASQAEADENFRVVSVQSRVLEAILLLDADFEFALGDAPEQALRSGVPLHFTIEIELIRERSWWLDLQVARLNQRYRLAFNNLSQRFVLQNLNTDSRRSYLSLGDALDDMGKLHNYPLIDQILLGTFQHLQGRIRTRLELGQLPLPLLPGAYLSRDWRLESEWYWWQVE